MAGEPSTQRFCQNGTISGATCDPVPQRGIEAIESEFLHDLSLPETTIEQDFLDAFSRTCHNAIIGVHDIRAFLPNLGALIPQPLQDRLTLIRSGLRPGILYLLQAGPPLLHTGGE